MRRQHDTPSDDAVSGRAPRATVRGVAAIAERQHGNVTRVQLIALGMKSRAIDRRVEAGKFKRMHRGVYLLGLIPPPHAEEMAAVLACGPGAVLSHASAAALWHLLPYPARSHKPTVTVPGRNPGPKPDITIHRVRSLRADETTTRHRIPVTTPARTLLDFTATADLEELEQAVAEAHAKNLARRPGLLSLLARHPRHRGSKRLRAVLEADGGPALTRSKAERRFLALMRRARLPAPEANVRVGDFVVDFLWREQRLVVEVDGYAFHSSPASFARDHRREVDLAGDGFRVVRASWHQIVAEPEATVVRIGLALARPH